MREDVDREVTDDEGGEIAEGEEAEMGEEIGLGETVTKGDENDPKRKTWTRIEALPTDARTERHEETTFKNLQIRDGTTELDIFLALLPLTPAELLQIVRDGCERTGVKYKWTVEHIFSALCIIFGAGQFKAGTDLWSVTRKGRCTSCRARNKRFEKKVRAPNTAWGCVCHPGLYFCKNKTCWAEHLRQVRIDEDIEMEI